MLRKKVSSSTNESNQLNHFYFIASVEKEKNSEEILPVGH